MVGHPNRRTLLQGSAAALLFGQSGATCVEAASCSAAIDQNPFGYALNTSTLMGHKLPIDEELKLIAAVGYGGVEPWVRELEAYQQSGKSVDDLGKLTRDLGLAVPSAIAFFEWIVDDDARRKAGLETARRNMEMVRKLGATHIAAPAAGATDVAGMSFDAIADRYRELLKIGRDIGVLPELEVWGFSRTLGTLADVAHVAVACGEPDVTILPDVYHLYKGGSSHHGLRVLNGRAIPAIHMNDYPADPARASIGDADRIYPGDGIAPVAEILRTLHGIGFGGFLSLELFNREYWSQDPKTVAERGLHKMQAAVQNAFQST